MRKHLLLLTALILVGAGCVRASAPVGSGGPVGPAPSGGADQGIDQRCATYAPLIDKILAKAVTDVPDITSRMDGLFYSPSLKTCIYQNYVERKADGGAAGTYSFFDEGKGGQTMISFYFDDQSGIPDLSHATIQARVESFKKILTTGSAADIQAAIDARNKELAPNP